MNLQDRDILLIVSSILVAILLFWAGRWATTAEKPSDLPDFRIRRFGLTLIYWAILASLTVIWITAIKGPVEPASKFVLVLFYFSLAIASLEVLLSFLAVTCKVVFDMDLWAPFLMINLGTFRRADVTFGFAIFLFTALMAGEYKSRLWIASACASFICVMILLVYIACRICPIYRSKLCAACKLLRQRAK